MFGIILQIISNIFYFALHVTNSGSFPKPLSPDDEKRLVALCEQGDESAKKTLIEHNLRLVVHVIKKYYNTNAEQEDLISIGTIGLIKGITSFKSDKGIKLATYASRCIENEILMYFRSLKKTSQDVFINDSIDVDKDGNSLTLLDIVADNVNIEQDIETAICCEKLADFVEECLTERERMIIKLRYGIGGDREMTQREVAALLGISRSYVSRIEKKALTKLHSRFEKCESGKML